MNAFDIFLMSYEQFKANLLAINSENYSNILQRLKTTARSKNGPKLIKYS